MNPNMAQPQPLGWCRAERLRRGIDEVVEQTDDYTLVRCIDIDSLHGGHWILWDGPGKCVAVGPESWVRRKLAEAVAAVDPFDGETPV